MDPEEEERIRRRQAGTQVTPESFLAWKQRFDAEMLAIKMASDPSSVIAEDDRVRRLYADAPSS